jgi:hypothetical protein
MKAAWQGFVGPFVLLGLTVRAVWRVWSDFVNGRRV